MLKVRNGGVARSRCWSGPLVVHLHPSHAKNHQYKNGLFTLILAPLVAFQFLGVIFTRVLEIPDRKLNNLMGITLMIYEDFIESL